MDQVRHNLKYLRSCVTNLQAASKKFTREQFDTYRKVLKDEHELFKLEHETEVELLSTAELKKFQRKVQLKKLKL